MLTVDYERLGLRSGELALDLGCGAGRHVFQSLRNGARVVAFDYDEGELREVAALSAAMGDAGEIGLGGNGAACRGDAVHLPFPDDTFDRIIAAEVLEHIPDDHGAMRELQRVLKPGGTIAVTVPAWLAEQVCWKLSDEYHAPFVEGGHVRIYSESELRRKLRNVGLQPGDAHHAHALHSPYWWLRCAIDPQGSDDHPLVKAYHRLLVWDITDRPLVTRLAEALLNPVIGKSLVVYATKAPTTASAAQPHTTAGSAA